MKKQIDFNSDGELIKRKNLRLSGYDYNSDGYYFVTICTPQKEPLFGSVECVGAIHESPVVQLSKMGMVVDRVIQSLPVRFTEIGIDKYVVMPNHVHILFHICRNNEEAAERAIHESPLRPTRSLYSKVIGYLKATASKEIHRTIMKDTLIWQRGSYDHIIRNPQDFQRIMEYIHTNPAKWEEDIYYRGTSPCKITSTSRAPVSTT